ncbi:MAG: c-type cytochrome [Gemmatimonadales bacterium]
MTTRMHLVGIVLAATLSGATSVAAQSLPPGVTKEMITQGDAVFHGAGLCFACHGNDAKGAVGPNLTDDEWLHSKGTYDDIVKSIQTGTTKEQSKSGNIMPPKGGADISDADVKAVAAYVWSLSHKTS